MKIGDLVACWPQGIPAVSPMVRGIIVGFNKKREGGKDFVHVLCEEEVLIFMSFDIEVISENR
jgi:hypothetical protein